MKNWFLIPLILINIRFAIEVSIVEGEHGLKMSPKEFGSSVNQGYRLP
jgi:hypothetical protein